MGFLKNILAAFSCEEYSRSASKQLDAQLSLNEKFTLLFHHCVCFTCRRFNSQIKLLDKACKKLADGEKPTCLHAGKQSLSPEAKRKIECSLKAEFSDIKH